MTTMIAAAMHKFAFSKHRERVRNAKSEVDHRPSVYFPTQGHLIHPKIDLEPANSKKPSLVRRINRTSSTNGVIDTFRESSRLHRLEQVNHFFGKRIPDQKGDLQTRVPAKNCLKHRGKLLKESPIHSPDNIMSNCGKRVVWSLPKRKDNQRKLMRPRIYLQLAVKGIRPLGRLVIELYTETSPQMVLEFMHICFRNDSKRLSFLRLFPSLGLEGKRLGDSRSLTYERQQHDMRAADHASSYRILSYSINYLTDFKWGFINFAISFKSILSERRVGVGRIVQGLRILDSIQDYGTKNNKPRKEIQITACGVMP